MMKIWIEMNSDDMQETLTLKSGVSASLADNVLSVDGPNGKVAVRIPVVELNVKGQEVTIASQSKAKMNTAIALLRSAEKGVTDGYVKKLQIIYVHFPITFEIKGKDIYVKNFLGEKVPRIAGIVGDTKVKVEKEFISVSGPDKYAVGQTAANIRTATKIKQKDPRVFQDGVYPVES
jgi:large subunit ribosomal protein L6